MATKPASHLLPGPEQQQRRVPWQSIYYDPITIPFERQQEEEEVPGRISRSQDVMWKPPVIVNFQYYVNSSVLIHIYGTSLKYPLFHLSEDVAPVFMTICSRWEEEEEVDVVSWFPFPGRNYFRPFKYKSNLFVESCWLIVSFVLSLFLFLSNSPPEAQLDVVYAKQQLNYRGTVERKRLLKWFNRQV